MPCKPVVFKFVENLLKIFKRVPWPVLLDEMESYLVNLVGRLFYHVDLELSVGNRGRPDSGVNIVNTLVSDC